MDKESSLKMAQVVHDTRQALVKVAAERDELKVKVARFERRQAATKVASAMQDKGINLDVEFPELVMQLEKEAEAGRLETIAQATEMIGPQMSFGSANHDSAVGRGSDAFTSFLVGDVG